MKRFLLFFCLFNATAFAHIETRFSEYSVQALDFESKTKTSKSKRRFWHSGGSSRHECQSKNSNQPNYQKDCNKIFGRDLFFAIIVGLFYLMKWKNKK